MPGRLHLYRFAGDAWAGGLQAWCGPGGWLLAENLGQARWLMRKLAGAGIAGIRIFDSRAFREELAVLAGLQAPPRNPADAAFAVKVAAGDAETARNANALAEACDALARAGWHLNQLGIETAAARRVHRILDRTALLPGFFDRQLPGALPPQPTRLCCVGWDALHWPDIALLELAAAKFIDFEMYVPSPRLPADALQREWIETLEQRLGLERVACPESGFVSENEPLVARLENSQLADRVEARPPILLVGREWPDQVGLVRDEIAKRLKAGPALEEPIGIIAPEDSPTAIAVADALQKAGVLVECTPRLREPAPARLILEQVASYHLGGCDVAELLELARLLWVHARDAWRPLEPEAVQDALSRAFDAAQSRNARILAQALPNRKDPCWTAVRELVEALGRWEEPLPWPALRAKWETMLLALSLPPDCDTPWPAGLFKDEPVPARACMEWLADHLHAERRTVVPPDDSAPAPVVVTTFAGAAQQSWSRLIFLDSNEHSWPAPIPENPFLPDAARRRLNGTRKESGHLLTTRDARTLEQARFLDLIEHCRGPIAFAGLLLDQLETGDHAQPNEWVLRALMETANDDEFPPELWAASARAYPPIAPPPLDPSERTHLEIVHGARHNGTMPFDRYQFNYHETKLEPGAWSATGLDEAITCPATFALRELLGAESTAGWLPARNEGAAVGNRAHRWLGRILGLGDHLAPPRPATDDDQKLARELAAARRELEDWYGAEGLPLPLWWESCLRKTAWATRRCLREVRGWLDGGYCAMEQKLAVTVRTPSGPLPLKGRIDILISDIPGLSGASLRMFDFKTGRGQAPTLSTLQRGSGAQFAAYYLMARDAGAAKAVIGIIKPEDRALDVFAADDEPALRAHFALLANLWLNKRFGRRGPLVTDHGVCETLPLATVPIDPAILDQKAGLFLLAS